ncbi:uncharacterized protein LOC116249162 [Nymphaea colorata]|nr:uncharacterized protein LOC116249162 [Nymphaea colorata]
MVECKRLIIPVFFDVEPRDVRGQSGPFEPAFTRYGKNDITDKEEVRKWRNALTEAGEVSGYTLANTCIVEATEIKKIVTRILEEVNRAPLFIGATHPIGLDSRIAELVEVLDVEAHNDVKMVGIHGMGGIGKTTLARAVYNKLFLHFDACSFISDVREAAKQSKLVSLQEQLLRDVLKDEKVKVNDTAHGTGMIMDRIKHKKVLLVLDDVDSESQLGALVGSVDHFQPGSRIIITTRDMQVLIEPPTLRVENVYEIKKLDFAQSLQLFSWHAFGKEEPPAEFAKISKEVAATASGLPLALKIFGRHFLCQKTNKLREAMLQKLKKVQDKDIHEKLKISFDALDNEERIVFLDIACFFIGQKRSFATFMWKERGFFPDLTIEVLKHKCLVNINKDTGKFEMHDSIRDMGRKIVEDESPNPENRSRLWQKDDILKVLREKKGTEKIEAINLSCEQRSTPYVNAKFFEGMSQLKMLQLWNVRLEGKYRDFPRTLRYLRWNSQDLHCLPDELSLEDIVVLDLSWSYNMHQVWHQQRQGSGSTKVFSQLKVLNLSGCRRLTICPDFTGMPHIEELYLEYCDAFTELHPSIWRFTSLKVLDLSGCEITALPSQPSDSKSLKQPLLDRLKVLNLAFCLNLTTCPDFSFMPYIEELDFSNCEKLTELHRSIWNLKRLTRLSLRYCESLEEGFEEVWQLTSLEKLDLSFCERITLPSRDSSSLNQLLDKLKILHLRNCGNLTLCPNFTGMPHLQELDFEGCKNLNELDPSIGHLKRVTHLSLKGCNSLKELPVEVWQLTSLEELDVSECYGITALPSQLMKSMLGKLKALSLKDCPNLTRSPNFTCTPNIEKLNFGCCFNMTNLHPSIGQLKSLTYLSLWGCQSLKELPEGVWQLTSLEELDLSQCYQITALPSQLKKPMLGKLKALSLKDCRNLIRSPNFTSMPHLKKLLFDGCVKLTELHPSIGHLKSLTHLSLWSCESLKELPEGVWQLTSLEELNLSGCYQITALPSQLKQPMLGKLKALCLLNCPNLTISPNFTSMPHIEKLLFDGCVKLIQLCPSIGHLRRLTHLSLRKCESLKELPVEVWHLTSLEELDLCSCKNLTVRADFTCMPHIEKLDFSHCEKLTELHPSIGHLKSLTHLSLKECKSLKELPKDVWQLTSLENLDLGYCCKIATLPSELGNLKRFKQLFLDGTIITALPESMRHLKQLKHLSLNECRFLKEIPEWIRSCISLEQLEAKNCESLASFPNVLGDLRSLRYLNLSGTAIEKLPSSIHSLMQFYQLSIIGCKRLKFLPQLPRSIHSVYAKGCCEMEEIADVSQAIDLRELDLTGCQKLVDVPGVELLRCLMRLKLEGCRSLSNSFKKRVQEAHFPNLMVQLTIPGSMEESCLPHPNEHQSQVSDREAKEKQLREGGQEKQVLSGCRRERRACAGQVNAETLAKGDPRLRLMKRSRSPRYSDRSVYEDAEEAPSSSSTPPVREDGFQYDVFLSFRGPDTRNRFTGHLYQALQEKGIHTFIDSEKLEKGEKVEKLFGYIERSKIFVPIFSKGYADSEWCLKEITKMVECERLIIPIFFEVEPRDVRSQSGPFEPAFTRYDDNYITNKEEVRKWRNALIEAGKVSGYNLANTDGYEARLIKLIVKRILTEVNMTPLFVAEHRVGLDSRVVELVEMLKVGFQNDVKMVGIHGMGGIGKTTLAREVYNQICPHFDAFSFISGVGEAAKQSKLVSLQEQLLRDVLKDKKVKVNDTAHGTGMIMKRIKSKKVLLVLDDIDSKPQLGALAGSVDWFCSGSRIIITTRNKQVLIGPLSVENVYELKLLDDSQSLQLFCWHAFGKEEPEAEIVELSKEVAATAAGLPLALEIFGRHFSCLGTNKLREDMLKKLLKDHHKDIHERMKISFDALEKEEKIIFLDIACFFIGQQRSFATFIWKERGFFPDLTIEVLMHKCLVNFNEHTGAFEMHDHIRDMGRKIVEDESPNPENRSRLWKKDDILNVLQEEKGTEKVEAINLSCEQHSTPYVNTKSCVGMSQLKMLQLRNVSLKGKYKYFPRTLRWLHWNSQDLRCLPNELSLENIVVLDLSWSYNMHQVWHQKRSGSTKVFSQLKVLSLTGCENLTICPDFTGMPHIEELYLKGCMALTELHPSIWRLTSLQVLDLSRCSQITALPSQPSDSKSLKQPLLDRLKVLNLSSCYKLTTCPDFLCMPYIEELDFGSCANMTELHPSIWNLKRLTRLSLRECESLEEGFEEVWRLVSLEKLDLSLCERITLPSRDSSSLNQLLGKLKILHLPHCLSLTICPNFTRMPHLEELDFDGCMELNQLDPSIGHLKRLTHLSLERCLSLKELPVEVWQLTSLEELKLTCRSENIALPSQLKQPMLGKLKALYLLLCWNLTISPNFTSMPHLQKLHFEDCVKFIQLCPSIGHLKSLTHLSLKKCTSLKELPKEVWQLTSLEELDLSECYGITALPSQLKRPMLSKLKVMNLRSCKSLTICPVFTCMPHIEKLDFSDCQKLIELDPSIGHLKSLTHLSLKECKSLKALPKEVWQLTSIKILELIGCYQMTTFPLFWDSKSLEQLFPQEVSRLTSQEELHLSLCSQFATSILESVDSMPLKLPLLGKVKVLSLGNCQNLLMCPDFTTMPHLEELDFEACGNMIELHPSIGRLQSLTHLNLRGCGSLNELTKDAWQLTSLENLDLRYCCKIATLPSELGNSERLKQLFLDGTIITALPESIRHLKQLNHLSLNKCYLLKEIPEGIHSCISLEQLEARNCVSLASLPNALGNLRSLRNLDLSWTAIEELPSSIHSLMQFYELSIVGCKRLKFLPQLPRSIRRVYAADCCKMEEIADVSKAIDLWELDLTGCQKLLDVPGVEQLICLNELKLGGCRSLSNSFKKRVQEADFPSLVEELTIPGSDARSHSSSWHMGSLSWAGSPPWGGSKSMLGRKLYFWN